MIQQVEQFDQQKAGQPVHKYTTEYKYDGLLRLTDELVTNEKAESVHKRYRYDGNNNLLAEIRVTSAVPARAGSTHTTNKTSW